MLSFETTVTLSVGYEVAYASPGWVSPTGSVDGVWTDEPLAYDEDTGTYAYGAVPKNGWSGYIEFSIDAIDCDKVRAWVNEGIVNVSNWEVDVYYSGAWDTIFTGSEPLYGQYVEFPIGSTESVTGMRLRAYSTKADSAGALVYEVDFNEVGLVPDISNTPNSFDFGTVEASSTPDTTTGWFTITNSSSVTIDITIKCNGWTHTAGSNDWIYGASAENTARLKASNDQGGAGGSTGAGNYDIVVPSGETGTLFCDDVATSTTTINWELQLEAPSSFTHSDPQITTVTLTATAA